MPYGAAHPVMAVGEISFAPVQNRMPVAAAGSFDFLAQAMRLVEKIVTQPQAGATAKPHVAVVQKATGELQAQFDELKAAFVQFQKDHGLTAAG